MVCVPPSRGSLPEMSSSYCLVEVDVVVVGVIEEIFKGLKNPEVVRSSELFWRLTGDTNPP